MHINSLKHFLVDCCCCFFFHRKQKAEDAKLPMIVLEEARVPEELLFVKSGNAVFCLSENVAVISLLTTS